MPSIVLATADDLLRARVLEQLAAEGRGAACCATWGEALVHTAHESTRLVLMDGELPEASGPLLETLCAALPHRPEARALRGELTPLRSLRNLAQLGRLARDAVGSPLDATERRLLAVWGLGPEPLPLLQRLAQSPLPLRFHAARGMGKQWVARLVHRVADDRPPFVVVRPGDEPVVREGSTGTLYLENLELHPPQGIRATLALAEATGWRVMAGSREPPDARREGIAWTQVPLRPLRDRPQDIRPLSRLYLDRWRTRLGLPRRRVHASLWARIEQHPWPGNHRELETFIVQAATSARVDVLTPDSLPRRVMALLERSQQDEGERRAFEELVEARLRPVVGRYEPEPDGSTLHRRVIDATERALLRVALGRTGGNQKAAAELLGVARNTLRERMVRLDPFGESE